MTDQQAPESAIGARLRQVRLGAGKSLSAVAAEVGISASALSQIETGAMQPSVSRLIEIVGVVGVPVSAIFDDHEVLHPRADAADASEPIPGVHVAAAAARTETTLAQGVVYRRLTPVDLAGMDVFESLYPPGSSSSVDGAMMVHSGYEVGAVRTGTLRFEFTEGSVELDAGGSLAFWATRPHRVVNDTDQPASAIWLTLRDLSEG